MLHVLLKLNIIPQLHIALLPFGSAKIACIEGISNHSTGTGVNRNCFFLSTIDSNRCILFHSTGSQLWDIRVQKHIGIGCNQLKKSTFIFTLFYKSLAFLHTGHSVSSHPETLTPYYSDQIQLIAMEILCT